MYHREMHALLAIVACVFLGTSQAHADRITSPQELLERARAVTYLPSPSRVVTVVEYKFDSEAAGQDYGGKFKVRRYARDDETHLKLTFDRDAEAGRNNPPVESEQVFAGDLGFIYLPFRNRVQLARVAEDVNRWRDNLVHDYKYGTFLDGYIFAGNAGNQSVINLALLSSPKLLPMVEKIDGVECRIVEALTSGGLLRLWIAPSKDFCLAKYEIEQDGHEDGSLAKFKATFDQAEFEKIDDRTILVAGRFTTKVVPVSPREPAYSETVLARRTEVDLHPQFDDPKLFSPSTVPDGAEVWVEDDLDSGVRYIWRDGAAVPAVNEQTLDSIRQEVSDRLPSVPAGHEQKSRTTPSLTTSLADTPVSPATASTESLSRRYALLIGLTITAVILGFIVLLFVMRDKRLAKK